MKKLFVGLLVVLVLLLVFIGVLVGRAWQLPSLQPNVEPAADVLVDEASAVDRLAGAIRFPTVSYQDPARLDSSAFLGLHTYLEAAFPSVHQTLGREVVSDLSLLYTWEGTDSTQQPILLASHLDVVPVPEGAAWEYAPFGGAVAEGYVWGRGTLDDKVSVLAILEAVEGLVRSGFQPGRTVYLAFGHDEEVGGARGAVPMAEVLAARGVRLAFALDEGGFVSEGVVPGVAAPVALVGIAEKGYVTLALSVASEGGHSSAPPRHTAVGRLARAVAALEDEQMPAEISGVTETFLAYLAPEMALPERTLMSNLWVTRPLIIRLLSGQPGTNATVRTTTAPTVFHGGTKENVLPKEASALVNFRIRPGETVEDVMAHARRVIADEHVRIVVSERSGGRDPSAVSSTTSDAFQTLHRSIREVLGDDVVVTPYLVTGGTDGRFYEPVADDVYRFLPIPLGADDMTRFHGDDERIATDAYVDAVRFYHHLIRKTTDPTANAPADGPR